MAINKSELISRLKEAYKIKTDLELSKLLDIAPSTISTWKVRNSIDFDIIFAKCENINFNFLIYGHGKPFINCEDNIEEAAKLILSENYHDELENLKILTEKNERQFMNLSNEMKLLREKLNLIGGEADPEDPEE